MIVSMAKWLKIQLVSFVSDGKNSHRGLEGKERKQRLVLKIALQSLRVF